MYKLLENKIVYEVDGVEKAILEFAVNDGVADIYHTYTDNDLRGQGVAGELVKRAFEYFEKEGYEVRCSCSYAQNWALKKGKNII